MRRSSRLVLLLGAFLAVVTFVVVLLISNGGTANQAAPTAPSELATVVAARDVPLGEVVTTDMVQSKTLAVANRDAGALGDVSQAIGKVARKPIAAGGQVHASDFGTATAQLAVPAGKRAFALQLDETTDVGNLVYAGDYVDVVIALGDKAIPLAKRNPINPSIFDLVSPPGTCTEPFHCGSGPIGASPLTVKASLLLQEIQILGTIDSPGKATQAGAAPAAGASPLPTGPTLTGNPRLIVLAVTDAQAEALIYARTVGKIDLVLRSPADRGTTEVTSGVVLKTLLDTYGVLPPYAQANIDAFVVNNP